MRNCLPKWPYNFTFPKAMNESSYCSTSSPAFVVSVPDFGPSDRYVVVFHWYFNLQFPDGI